MAEIQKWTVGAGALGKGGLCGAIGNFDGVHKGHQALIAHARRAAKSTGLPLAVICFFAAPPPIFSARSRAIFADGQPYQSKIAGHARCRYRYRNRL